MKSLTIQNMDYHNFIKLNQYVVFDCNTDPSVLSYYVGLQNVFYLGLCVRDIYSKKDKLNKL